MSLQTNMAATTDQTTAWKVQVSATLTWNYHLLSFYLRSKRCESVLRWWVIVLFANALTLFPHNWREMNPGLNSLCAGDVPPPRLGGFRRRSSLILPRHEHVWGQLHVLVVFGQGEQGAAARMALWQGKPHVCIFRLRRTKYANINVLESHLWVNSK